MLDKMKQFMEVKRQAEMVKRQLDDLEIAVNEVNGIQIVIDGSQNFKSIMVEEDFLRSNSKERIESDFLRSVKAAVKASQEAAARKMKEVLPFFPGM